MIFLDACFWQLYYNVSERRHQATRRTRWWRVCPYLQETNRLQIHNNNNKQIVHTLPRMAESGSNPAEHATFLVIFQPQPLVHGNHQQISRSHVARTWLLWIFHLGRRDVSQKLNQIQLLQWALALACVGVRRQENGDFPRGCDGLSRIASLKVSYKSGFSSLILDLVLRP